MRATCPSCEAVYEIPDRLAVAGRRLRCANCGHEWALAQLAPQPPPAPPPLPVAPGPMMPLTPYPPAYTYAPTPEPPQASLPPTRPMLRRPPQVIDPPLPPVDDAAGFRGGRGEIALRVAWIGSVLLVVVALATLWTFRYEIATAWPPAARLVGTPVSGG
jgi:predicted Zn finger-like uncharacterized protein